MSYIKKKNKIKKDGTVSHQGENNEGIRKEIDKWLEVAEEVLNDDINAIILTDEELLITINDKLDNKEDIISYATFKNWKSKTVNCKTQEEFDKLEDKLKKFLAIYKKAIIVQKRNLFKKLQDSHLWQKYAWIIERKFAEWNLKKIVDDKREDRTANEIEKMRNDMKSIFKK